jgi:hypothetical protein
MGKNSANIITLALREYHVNHPRVSVKLEYSRLQWYRNVNWESPWTQFIPMFAFNLNTKVYVTFDFHSFSMASREYLERKNRIWKKI